jgi:NADPH-dependent curcumin reductase CurA
MRSHNGIISMHLIALITIMGNIASLFSRPTLSSLPTTLRNKRWVLTQYPKGNFNATRDAELVEDQIDLSTVSDDMVVVEVKALSVDAFIRTMLDDTENVAHGTAGLGSTIPALGYGKIIKGNKKFKEGAMVTGLLGATKYAVLPSMGLQASITLPRAKPTASLSILGISGIAAYVGMFVSPSKCPQKGETVVVSAAAGAVGCIAAQMAKLCGARVIGVAGGPKKQQFLLDELKLDLAIDYKSKEKSIGQQLDESCPDGIDFFFDNVGGQLLDEVLQRINLHSRTVICGAVSQYDSGNINNKSLINGPSHYIKLAEMSSTISGFNMMHYTSSFLGAFRYLAWHYYRGNIFCPEHVENGIGSFGSCLEKLFAGGHVGRLVIDLEGIE